MTSVQLNEATSHDWVLGAGYKLSNFNLFGGGNHRKVKSKKKGDDESNSQSSSKSGRNSNNTGHDLNLRLDVSYRKQANISRDIATMTSSASSGNTAFKLSFTADYTL